MIVIIKLKNDDHVMGKMEIENEKSIKLRDAMLMYSMIDEKSGMPRVYFVKYSNYTVGMDVDFDLDFVLHVFKDPLEDIVKYYRNYVGRCKALMKKISDKNFKEEIERLSLTDIEDADDNDTENWLQLISPKNKKDVH